MNTSSPVRIIHLDNVVSFRRVFLKFAIIFDNLFEMSIDSATGGPFGVVLKYKYT
jgi:hypothetical protein